MLTYTSLFLLSVFIFLLVGSFIVSLFYKNKKADSEFVFYALLVAISLSVFAVSNIATGFRTVYLLLLFPAFIIFYQNKSKLKFDFQQFLLNVKTTFPYFLIYAIIFYSIILLIHHPMLTQAKLNHMDIAFYSDISEYMLKYGLERSGVYLGEFLGIGTGLNPYHYFEIWFTSLFNVIYHSSPAVLNYFFLSFPILLFAISVGFIAIVQRIFDFNIFLSTIIAFLLMFFGPLLISSANFEIMFLHINAFAPAKKYTPLVLYAIAFYLNFNNKYTAAAIASCFILLSVGTVASVAGVILFFLILAFYYKDKSYALASLIPFALVILFGLFYYVNGSSVVGNINNVPAKVNLSQIEVYKRLIIFPSFTNFKLLIGLSLELFVRFLKNWHFFTFFLFIPLFLKGKEKNIFILLVCVLFIGFIFSGLFYPQTNNNQLLYNNLPILLVFITGSFLSFMQQNRNKIIKTFFFFIVSGLIIFNVYNVVKTERVYQTHGGMIYMTDDAKITLKKYISENSRAALIRYYPDNYDCSSLFAIPGWFMNFEKPRVSALVTMNINHNCDSVYLKNQQLNFHPFLFAHYRGLIKDKNDIKNFIFRNNIKYFLIENNAVFPFDSVVNISKVDDFKDNNYNLFKIVDK